MGVKLRTPFFLLLVVIHNFISCFAIEIISPTQLVTDSGSIISFNQTFKLGFFCPRNTSNRYVGIWYNTLPGETTVVWVANRENPLTNSLGVLKISDDDGNLVLLDGNQRVVWSTNVSVAANSSEAVLLDTGNFVLREISSERILWQSFAYPTDTFLEDMRFGDNTKTGEKQVLTSWKTDVDPSKGRFYLELEILNIPQLVLWNGTRRNWRSGPWDGRVFSGVEGMYSNYQDGFSVVREEQEGNVYLVLSNLKTPLHVRYVLNSVGKISETHFDEEANQWVDDWSAPQAECDFYGKCGPFGFCNLKNDPLCSCFSGYEPSSQDEWNAGNWSSGCVKRTPLQCDRETRDGTEVKEDGFVKHERMKVPDIANWVRGRELEDCKQTCMSNCSCIAYSYGTSFGCMWWNGTLIDAEKISTGGLDLYIRVAHSELATKSNLKVIATVTVLSGLLTVGLGVYITWRCVKKQKGKKKRYMDVLVLGKSGSSKGFTDSEKLDPELSIFKYEIIAVATDYFKLSNKLGEGGFGSVYKGKLPNGQEIAVKRLSKSSGQGTEEFKNEVAVISRLQHRNLVRLLGCGIGGDEKMLIYEYMPNKSLDSFLFDPTKKACLDWRKCFQIIEGIGRGILYLHRDSRWKVIHRDLKPSNILLDANLNPKISDFGMARIFGSDELQANTRRVVGTYGYMSPEYAMEGLFSEKSDVYSFGVLLLEIVTGMRNTGFYHHQESSSLILHVWRLWNEDKTEELIDPMVSEPSFKEEIIRCIHVGLLCVQDFAKDRPNMSLIISMLTSEVTGLPSPKQPAFIDRQVVTDSSSFCGSNNNCSKNFVSITTLQGR